MAAETQDQQNQQDKLDNPKPLDTDKGVDVNEHMVATHPGFEKASDEPVDGDHIGGQTPANETNQPTYIGPDPLLVALTTAETALRGGLTYRNGFAVVSGDTLDAVIKPLEDALKHARAAKKSAND